MFDAYEVLNDEYRSEMSDREITGSGFGNWNDFKHLTPDDDLSELEYLSFKLGRRLKTDNDWKLADWISALSRCKKLRMCFFNNPTLHQEMLDAFCKIESLERLVLHTYRSRVENLERIENLSKLTHLVIHSSPRITDLAPLAKLKSIKALTFDGNYGTHDLTPLKNIETLEGLSIAGRSNKRWIIESLDFIDQLPNLKALGFGHFEIADASLDAVAAHPTLEYLKIHSDELKRIPLQEYVSLWEKRPDLKFAYLEPAATNEKFQKKYRIK